MAASRRSPRGLPGWTNTIPAAHVSAATATSAMRAAGRRAKSASGPATRMRVTAPPRAAAEATFPGNVGVPPLNHKHPHVAEPENQVCGGVSAFSCLQANRSRLSTAMPRTQDLAPSSRPSAGERRDCRRNRIGSRPNRLIGRGVAALEIVVVPVKPIPRLKRTLRTTRGTSNARMSHPAQATLPHRRSRARTTRPAAVMSTPAKSGIYRIVAPVRVLRNTTCKAANATRLHARRPSVRECPDARACSDPKGVHPQTTGNNARTPRNGVVKKTPATGSMAVNPGIAGNPSRDACTYGKTEFTSHGCHR